MTRAIKEATEAPPCAIGAVVLGRVKFSVSLIVVNSWWARGLLRSWSIE